MTRLRVSRRAVASIVVPSLAGLVLVAVPAQSASASPGDVYAPVVPVANSTSYTQTINRADGAVNLTYTLANGANGTVSQAATSTAAMNSRDAQGAVTFSPTQVASSTAAQLSNRNTAGCAAATPPARTDCGINGTVTIGFSSPVTNPTLHVAGLGAGSGTAIVSSYLKVTASTSSTAPANSAAFGNVLGTATNLSSTGGQVQTTGNLPSTQCSGTLGAGATTPAGCGSILVNGSNLTSITVSLGLLNSGDAQVVNNNTPDALTLTTTIPDKAPLGQAFSCSTNHVYALGVDGNIRQTDTTTGAQTFAGQINTGGNSPNSLGITRNGTAAYAIKQAADGSGATVVYRYDPTTNTTQSFPGPTVDPNANFIMGAVNPANDIYYVGYNNTGTAGLNIYGFNTTTNTAISGRVANVPGNTSSTSGDFTFSRLGLLVFVASTADGTNTANPLYYVPTPMPSSGANASLTSRIVSYLEPNDSAFNGIAFDSPTGYLYVNSTTNGQSVLRQLNPTTGAEISNAPQTYDGAAVDTTDDLATCQYNNSIRTQADVASRVNPGDQFTVTLSGGGIAPTLDVSGTTAGSDTGPQIGPDEIGGPFPAVAGATYNFAQTAANGTNLADYVTTWSCTNALNTNVSLASGTGNTGSFTFPEAPTSDGLPVFCTFSDAPVTSTVDIGITTDQAAYRVGSTVTYTVTVKNTSNVDLSNVVVNDPGNSACNNSYTTIAAGTTKTYTCTDTASVANTAKTVNVTAVNTRGTQASDSATTPVRTINPAISLTEVTGPASVSAVGDTVTYTYTVKNTGDSTLTNVGVASTPVTPAGNRTVTCDDTTLTAGSTTTCRATYAATQDDLDQGSIAENSVASGTPEAGQVVTAAANSSVPVTRSASLTAVQTASPTTAYNVGQTITYTVRVTNNGNVSVTAPTVTDTITTGGAVTITCPSGTITPGNFVDCTGTRQVAAADKARGSITTSAVANATGANGVTVPQSAASPATVAVVDAVTVTGASNPSAVTTAGQPVTYTYTVTNNSGGTITGLSLAATGPAGQNLPTNCALTTLTAGQQTTCTTSYTPTGADLDNGSVPVTGTVSGAAPGNVAFSSPPTTVAPAVQPSGSLVVTAGSNPTSATAGVPITYTFTIQNNTNQTVSNPALTATGPSGQSLPATCQTASIAPNTSGSCTVTYTPTQADIDNGSVPVTGTASATRPGGGTATAAPVTYAVPVTPTGGLSVTGGANRTSAVVGQPITYTYTVTNTGNQTVDGVSLPVTLPNGTTQNAACGSAQLGATGSASDSTTCTISYTPSQADIDSGSVPLSGQAQGTRGPNATPVQSGASVVSVPVNPTGGLSVSGTADRSSAVVGQPITYTYTVANTGNQTVDGLTLPVTLPDGSTQNAACGATQLAATGSAGAATTCTISYTPTQADIDSGSVPVSGQAQGTRGANATPVQSDASVVSVPVTPTGGLSVSGTANRTSAVAGQAITYTYTVTNTGNQTVNGLTLPVTLPNGSIQNAVCGAAQLAATGTTGDTTTCTISYTPSQADIDSGSVPLSGQAQGTRGPNGTAAQSDPVTVSVPVSPIGGLSVTGTADRTSAVAGQAITYTYTVTNTGNQTVNGLTLPVTLPDGSTRNAICGATQLAATGSAGASTACSVSYTPTQADIDSGSVPLSGQAQGTRGANATPVQSGASVVSVPVNPSGGLSVSGTANRTSAVVGQPITYTFTVANTGNQTVDGLLLPVTLPDGTSQDAVCAATQLAATGTTGDTTTCTISYTPTQADIDAGSVPVSGQAQGTRGANNTPVQSGDATVSVPVNPSGGISLTGTANRTSAVVGQPITYTFTATNTGNQTVDGLVVPVTLPDGTVRNAVCAATQLAAAGSAGASTTCTISYTPTQDDIDSGSAPASGTAEGTRGPNATAVSSSPAVVSEPVTPAGGLSVSGTADRTSAEAGQAITYTFTVTNTGNQTVDGLTLPVTLPDGTVRNATCAATQLAASGAAGDTTTCTLTYTPTQDDVDSGAVPVAGEATGTRGAGGTTVTSGPATVSVPVIDSSISLVKTAVLDDVDGSRTATAGDKVTWKITVTNDGRTTDTAIAVTDPTAGTVTCPVASLAPSATTVCTVAATTLTQALVDAGTVTNTATVAALGGGRALSDDSTATLALKSAAKLALVKTGVVTDANGDDVNDTGDGLVWRFTVTNTGNVTIDDVAVKDPTGGAVTCKVATLAPGKSTTCATASRVLTAAESDSGRLRNTATATGTAPNGSAVRSKVATATVRTAGVDNTGEGRGNGGTAPSSGDSPASNSAGPTASTGLAALPMLAWTSLSLLALGLALLVGGTARRRRRT